VTIEDAALTVKN